MRRWLLTAASLSLIPAALPATAQAQPQVLVRAEARIELRTTRAPGSVVVEGTLRDDLGQPLADRPITVRVIPDAVGGSSQQRALRTNTDGRFRATLELATGGYRLNATFQGEPMHERVEVERRLDLERADVRLRVNVPGHGRLDLDEETHVVDVIAESAEGVGNLHIDLLDELDRLLASGVTDGVGLVRVAIPSELLGSPGAGRITARSVADARRAEAQTEVPVVRFRATHLTLEASRTDVEVGEPVRFNGRLSDSRGPIDGRAVGLFAGEDAHLATVLTNDDGRFRAEVDTGPLAPGLLTIVGRFESDAPGRAAAESAPVAIRLGAVTAMPWLWLLLPTGLCALLLLLIARRAPRRPERGTAPPPPTPAGVILGSRMGRRDRTDVGGWVTDHGSEEPVVTATVTLLGERGAPRTTPVDAEGRFQMNDVPPGRWSLRAEANGYVVAEGRLVVPHRGEWSGMRVRLESLRDRAVAPFRRFALTILERSRLWGVWTNREVLARARATGLPEQPLTELSERVEVACYAENPPGREDVAAIELLAEGAVARVQRRASEDRSDTPSGERTLRTPGDGPEGHRD